MSHSLFEYPNRIVLMNDQKKFLESTLELNDGVLPLAHRFAGRSFCTPGERLRLAKNDLRPARLGGVGLDELWICCTTPIVTGTIDSEIGSTPFREGLDVQMKKQHPEQPLLLTKLYVYPRTLIRAFEYLY